MKITLKMHIPETGYNLAVSTESVYLPDLLEDITLFLRGCGFHLGGRLTIESEDSYSALDDVSIEEYSPEDEPSEKDSTEEVL